MASTNKLRVGIIGIGQYAAFTHVPRFRETCRAEIVAISRRSPDRLALAKKELAVPEAYTDWREMLDEAILDAVVVCTPNNLHAEPTIAALERGLHVLVEKPMTLTVQDARSMIEAANKAGKVLMVGYNTHGMGGWRSAKKLLSEGAIGKIRQINATCCVDLRLLWQQIDAAEGLQNWMQSSEITAAFLGDLFQPDNWHYDQEASGGGSFVDIGTHVIDLMLWLSGSQPAKVVASHQPLGGGMASVVNLQARLVDGSVLSLTFNDGVSGGDFNFYGQGRLTVFGDEGLLTADWTGFMVTDADEIYFERNGERTKVDFETEPVPPAAAFVATVLDNASNIAPPSEAAQAVALIESAYSSIKSGKWVDISP